MRWERAGSLKCCGIFGREPVRVRFPISLTLGGKAKFAAQVADLIECREGIGPLYISPEMDAV
jgi:hypothetical protein